MMKFFLDTINQLNPASKNIPSEEIKKRHEQTETQLHQNRKYLTSEKTRPTKSQKTPKNYFSLIPKFCSTNIDTVDPSKFLSKCHEDITPVDDPT